MTRLTDRYGVFIGVMMHIAANGINVNKTWLTGDWPLCVMWRFVYACLYFFDPRYPAPRAAGRAPVLVRGGR